MTSPIRVLVVDDSALMRKMVTEMLSQDSEIEVLAQARDGADALAKLEALRPDVITLDVEMPVMDGLVALGEIMRRRPTPVVMLSSLTQEGTETTLRCLERGAVDFVGKPGGSISLNIAAVAADLIAKVKVAARARVSPARSAPSPGPASGSTLSFTRSFLAGERVEKRTPGLNPLPSEGEGRSLATGERGLLAAGERGLTGVRAALGRGTTSRVLCIGASTGGPRALQTLVPALPADLDVPVVIVQHMPPGFTASLAQRLDATSPLCVREAAMGDALEPGKVLVAPGGHHLQFDAAGRVMLSDEPPIHGVRPAVDVTLDSLTRLCGRGLTAVLLTGMGRDGARGLKVLHGLGGVTLAEDESTCVVYGMPRAAQELGGVTWMLPLPELAAAAVRAVRAGV